MSSISTTCVPVAEELHSSRAAPHEVASQATAPSAKHNTHPEIVMGPIDGGAAIASPAKPRSFWLTLLGILIVLFVYSLDATTLAVAIPVCKSQNVLPQANKITCAKLTDLFPVDRTSARWADARVLLGQHVVPPGRHYRAAPVRGHIGHVWPQASADGGFCVLRRGVRCLCPSPEPARLDRGAYPAGSRRRRPRRPRRSHPGRHDHVEAARVVSRPYGHLHGPWECFGPHCRWPLHRFCHGTSFPSIKWSVQYMSLRGFDSTLLIFWACSGAGSVGSTFPCLLLPFPCSSSFSGCDLSRHPWLPSCAVLTGPVSYSF